MSKTVVLSPKLRALMTQRRACWPEGVRPMPLDPRLDVARCLTLQIINQAHSEGLREVDAWRAYSSGERVSQIAFVWWNAVTGEFDSDWHNSFESAQRYPCGAGFRIAALTKEQFKQLFG